ncbi:hypothetical protein FRC10_000749 [Ceratobasidium sp. 414]|nr:hypothetical protein FRC10_000749 [Ceratobasidium sp. 414]
MGEVQKPWIVVHHLNNSRSQRILWLLVCTLFPRPRQRSRPRLQQEELEVPYGVKKYQRTPDMLAPDELKSVHPLGISPVITDGELALAELGAIIGKEGTPAPLLVSRVIHSTVPDRSPAIIRPIVRAVFNALLAQMVDPRLKTHAEMIEAHLGKRPEVFFAGGDTPTAADFMTCFSLEAMIARVPAILGENIRLYVQHAHERPAYKRALERGGKLELA